MLTKGLGCLFLVDIGALVELFVESLDKILMLLRGGLGIAIIAETKLLKTLRKLLMIMIAHLAGRLAFLLCADRDRRAMAVAS